MTAKSSTGIAGATFAEISALLNRLGLTVEQWDALPHEARMPLLAQLRADKPSGWHDAISNAFCYINATHPAFPALRIAHASSMNPVQPSAAHTPGPFTAMDGDVLDRDGFAVLEAPNTYAISRKWLNDNPDKHWGAHDESHRDIEDEEREQIAERAARALNSHAALVKALKEAQGLIDRSAGEMLALAMSGPKHPKFDELCMGVFERANDWKSGRVALQLAEEGG